MSFHRLSAADGGSKGSEVVMLEKFFNPESVVIVGGDINRIGGHKNVTN